MSAVRALLRHLEDDGFAAAPRVLGSGLDRDGREVLTFIDGEFTQLGPWSMDGAAPVVPSAPGCGVVPLARPGAGQPGQGHRSLRCGPVEHRRPERLPVALIDWETAGPVDR